MDPFIPLMQERWLAGCDNGMQLRREIKEQGSGGSGALVSRWVAQQRGVLPAAGDGAGVAKRHTGYQTLLKQFVVERLYEEEKREGLV